MCSAVILFSLDHFQFGWGECHHTALCWKLSETTSINLLTSVSLTFKAYHAQQDYVQFGSLHSLTVSQCYLLKLCTLKTLPLSSHHTMGDAKRILMSTLWKCHSERLQHCPGVLYGVLYEGCWSTCCESCLQEIMWGGLEQIHAHVLCSTRTISMCHLVSRPMLHFTLPY